MNTSAGWRWRTGVKKSTCWGASCHVTGRCWNQPNFTPEVWDDPSTAWAHLLMVWITHCEKVLSFTSTLKSSDICGFQKKEKLQEKSFELKLVLPSLWGCIWAVQSSGPWLDRKRTSPSRCSAPPPSPPTLHLHKTQRRTWSHLDQTADTWRPDWRSEGYEGGLRWCSCAHVLCNT